ncbi:hypothetical protein ACHQM5_007974 [Ranunculus cassubicifolius]
MEEILVAALSIILIISLIPLYLWKRRQVSRSPQDDNQQAQQRETVVRNTATRRMRRRPVGGASSSSAPVEPVEENDDAGSDEEDVGGRSSKKKEKKRQERQAQRQAEEAARESRVTKQDRYAEMRRRKDEEREAQERQLEEEAQARKAKEEEAALLEFDKWKGEFSIDAEGTTEENDGQDETRGLLYDFVEYIKKHKCVPLEELAAEFKLRTQDCINRINSLESMGRLSGVMDDRGKYIYISKEEMIAVAEYIKRQGRVSISHLASQSNQFIDLEPKLEQLVDNSTATPGVIEVSS